MSTPNVHFSRSLALLRQERGISQRAAAKELGISQALLSHYENGAREPGLSFVAKACDFYNVSADFLLGRTLTRDGTTIVDARSLHDAGGDRDNVLRGSVLAILSRKLLVNSLGVLFDLLGKLGNKQAIRAASDYLGGAVYTLFRHLYSANPDNREDFFNLPAARFLGGAVRGDMIYAESDYAAALAEKGGAVPPPELNNDVLAAAYPATYQSLFQIIHNTGKRVNAQVELRTALQEKETAKPGKGKK